MYSSARTVEVTGCRAARPEARLRGASDRDRDMPLLQFTVDIVSWGAEREASIHMSTLAHPPGGLAAAALVCAAAGAPQAVVSKRTHSVNASRTR